ncbi:MAG: HdeD family acid-resistance protein [Nitrososphaerales archaeon]
MSASAAPNSAIAAPARQRPWWLTLILGISAIIIGAVMLWGTTATRVETYVFLVTMLGIYWLIWGIMELVYMFIDHTAWGWKLFMGIVSILAGGSILMYPLAAAIALPQIFVLVLGIWALMEGIILLFLAFRGGGWGAGILAVISIVLGLILIGDYGRIGSGLAMLWAAAIWALIGGIVLVVRAFQARNA